MLITEQQLLHIRPYVDPKTSIRHLSTAAICWGQTHCCAVASCDEGLVVDFITCSELLEWPQSHECRRNGYRRPSG
jgi:hypothetical protein